MAPTVAEGAKRGRGRPPKAESEKVAAKVGKSGRPRGRPPGSASKEKKPVTLSGGIKKKTATPTDTRAKRGPGRPPKSAVDASPKSAAPKKAVAPAKKTAAAKRKVAAPKMLPAVPVAEPAAPKRKPPTPRTLAVPGEKKSHGKRGRPRKSDAGTATLPKRAPGRPSKSATPGSTPKARGTPAAGKGGSPVLGDEPGVEAVDEDDRDTEAEPKSEDQGDVSPQQNGGKSEDGDEDEDEEAAQ